MSFKAKFLQLPIKAQIFTSLTIMITLVISLIIFISGEFSDVHQKYILSKRKEYFLNMKQQIIERNIFFMNLCLLQYDFLIKNFNYKIYQFLQQQFDFIGRMGQSSFDMSKIVIYEPSKDPAYNPSMNDDSIFIHCYTKINEVKEMIIQFSFLLLQTNYYFSLNNIKGTMNFRIPYYGDIPLIGVYQTFFPHSELFIAMNNSGIKEVYDKFNGDFDEYVKYINELSEQYYNYYKNFFIKYENKNLYFIDIMFKLRHYMFENYTKIKDDYEKEEYVRKQSTVFFGAI